MRGYSPPEEFRFSPQVWQVPSDLFREWRSLVAVGKKGYDITVSMGLEAKRKKLKVKQHLLLGKIPVLVSRFS